MEYRHKESPQLKKFKTQASAVKVVLTIFFGGGNSERVVLADFLQKKCSVYDCTVEDVE